MNKSIKLLYVILSSIYIVLFYLFLFFEKLTHTYVTAIPDIFQTIALAITVFILIKTSQKVSDSRKYFWVFLSIGCSLYFLSQIVWDYQEIIEKHNNPIFQYSLFGGFAHGIFYICAAILITYKKRDIYWLVTLIIDILTVLCLFTSIILVYVIIPLFRNYSLFLLLEYTVYPIGDLISLIVLGILFLSLKKDDIEKKPLALISLAFFILSIANLVYSFLSINTKYFTGSLIDPLWAGCFLILGLSGIEYMQLIDTTKNFAKINKHQRNYSIRSVNIIPLISVIILFILHLLTEDKTIQAFFEIGTLLVIVRHIVIIFQNKKLILSLQELNSNLESKVFERTKALSNIAFHDQLTGLGNRRLFENTLKRIIYFSKINNKQFALLFLDLDRFKIINDTLGHDVGDTLLKEISIRLNKCLNPNCFISRQGGDEFAIVIKNIQSIDEVNAISKKILFYLSKPISLNNHFTYITCSIGIALYPLHGDTLETLMKHADLAMYSSKALGKNTYEFYNFNIDKLNSKKLLVEQELRHAIANNEFKLYYQPQISMESEHLIGAEALIRWIHPKHGIISPIDFIPVAEETGLIDILGAWVLETACKQVKDWQNKGLIHFKIGVNVSPRQFKQENFVETVYKTLQSANLSPEYLDLEITETIAIENEFHAIKKLEALKKLNIKISIDDFGTGYSSLSYLTKFPIDTLKIDKSFVENIGKDSTSKTIVSSILAVSTSLNIDVIAEGVETREQWEFLKSQNCPKIQGYIFSPPLPANEFENLLKANSL